MSYLDAWIESQKLANRPELINIGLSSETVSGLSEDGHAGGQFPRPDLAERLDRVLKVAKPDLVIACYGMNCGIYLPLDDSRFEKYRKGIQSLREQVIRSGAKIIHITPPTYDDKLGKKGFEYNKVLDQYSQWLIDQQKEGWVVIDLHFPMSSELQKRRNENPDFTFQPDAVHPNTEGHWFIAKTIIEELGESRASKWNNASDMLNECNITKNQFILIQQRMRVLRDSFLSTAGHKRPGVAQGLPLEEALKQASELTSKMSSATE